MLPSDISPSVSPILDLLHKISKEVHAVPVN